MSLFDSMKKVFTPKGGEDRESLSKRVQASPQDPQARQKLGFHLLGEGQVVEGLDQLARAAIMYEKDGFSGKAVATLRTMLKHDPGNVDFIRWLIRLLSQEGLTGDALREVENVIGRHGFFVSEEQKLEFLRNASVCLPKSPLPYLHIADIYRSQRKFNEAINELDKAAMGVREAGLAGEFFERLAVIRRAAGNETEILEACGFLLLRVGKSTEAMSILSNVVEKTRIDGNFREADEMERVLNAIRGGGNVSNALSFRVAAEKISETLEEPPSPEPEQDFPMRTPEPPVPERTAVPEVQAEAPAETPAETPEETPEEIPEEIPVEIPATLPPAPSATPPSPSPPTPLMEIDSREDEEEIVQDALSRLQAKVSEEIGESDPEARYNLGIAFKEMGLLKEAVVEFRLARGKPELFVGASSLLAETLAASGKFAEAVAILGEVLSSGSLTDLERRDVRYHMADLLAREGKEKESNRIFLEIFKEAPGYRDVGSRTKNFRE